MHEGNPDDFQWDVVSGISGGAINACGMSVWAKEDGLAMSEWLSNEWENVLRTHEVWKWWPGGIIAGLTTKPSLVDDTPLTEFIATNLFGAFPNGVQRYSMIGSVNANNGDYKSWKLDEIAPE